MRACSAVRLLAVAAAVVLWVGGAGCRSGNSALPICNTLVIDGPIVSATAMAAAAPPAVGGTVVQGTYQLSTITFYTGPTGSTTAPNIQIAAIFEITGNVIQQAGYVNTQESRFTSTFTTSGTTLSFVDICPYSSAGMSSYSATPTSLSLYATTSNSVREQVFTLRAGPSDGGPPSEGGAPSDGGDASGDAATGDGG
jgi:hypothetical protein